MCIRDSATAQQPSEKWKMKKAKAEAEAKAKEKHERKNWRTRQKLNGHDFQVVDRSWKKAKAEAEAKYVKMKP